MATREELANYLAEGVHTGLRKAAFSPEAGQIWKLIHDLPDGDWTSAMLFAVDGLEMMGVIKLDRSRAAGQ